MEHKLSHSSMALGVTGLRAAGLASTASAATAPTWNQLLSVTNTPISSLFDESAVTFDAVVATGATIEHNNGTSWSATDVTSLLPATSSPQVAVVLHYDGTAWTQVASGSFQGGEQVASDGNGGLWVLAVKGNQEVLHYTGAP